MQPDSAAHVAEHVVAALEDSQGNLWFGTNGQGVACYTPSSSREARGALRYVSVTDGLIGDVVTDIVEDAQGHIWFGAITSDHPESIKEGGLSRYDPSKQPASGRHVFTQFPELEGLTANDIYNLYVVRSGRVWIGAVRVGAYRFDPTPEPGGQPFTLFDRTDRPDLTTVFGVQAMLEDRHGTLWFGFSGGLFRFNGTSFVNVTRGGPWSSP